MSRNVLTSTLSPPTFLQAGQSGLVQAIVGNPETVRHLAEIGLCNGTRSEMVRPGSTCILRIDGAKLCVRGDELLRVMVSPLPAARQSA